MSMNNESVHIRSDDIVVIVAQYEPALKLTVNELQGIDNVISERSIVTMETNTPHP